MSVGKADTQEAAAGFVFLLWKMWAFYGELSDVGRARVVSWLVITNATDMQELNRTCIDVGNVEYHSDYVTGQSEYSARRTCQILNH